MTFAVPDVAGVLAVLLFVEDDELDDPDDEVEVEEEEAVDCW